MTTHDLHQHFWPEEFVAALRSRETPPRLDGAELETREGRFVLDLRDHDVETRLGLLDRDRVDVGVLSLQPSLGLEALADEERTRLEDAWADGIRIVMSKAQGRFVAFSPARVRPGFVGVSIGSSALLDLDSVAPVFDAAAEKGVVVFVHPDAGPGGQANRPEWWEWVVGYPARMQEAYVAWLAGGRERWPTRQDPLRDAGGRRSLPARATRTKGSCTCARHSIRTRSSTSRRTDGGRSSSASRHSASASSRTAATRPVVDSQPTLDAVRGFGDAVTYVLQSDTPTRLLT